MEKEFVPYELALRMKQLGFDGSCFAIWSGIDEQNFSITDTIRLYSSGFIINGTQSSKFYINDFNSNRVSAPTYSQAFRWFRENHFLSSDISERMRDGKRITHFFISELKTNNKFFKTISSKLFTDYEEAELACLDKLLEIIEKEK